MPVVAPFSFIKAPSAAPTNNFSLQLNGSSQHVTLPGSPLDPDADFTIEAWVKLSAENSSNFIFSAVTDSNNYWGLVIRNDGNGFCFQEAIATATATFICTGSATITVADGWTHVAITRSGNTWTVYKNGVLLKTASNSHTGFAGAAQRIGSLLGPFSNYFSGKMDEIRIWDVARTAGDLLAYKGLVLPPSTPNLIGYWRLESGAGSTAIDELASNDGTLIGTPTWSSDTPFF